MMAAFGYSTERRQHTCSSYCGTGCDAPSFIACSCSSYRESDEQIEVNRVLRHIQSIEQKRDLLELLNPLLVWLFPVILLQPISNKITRIYRFCFDRHKSRQVRLYS